jgi:MscS family membrane protein
MHNFTSLIWACSAYILAALLIQILFFKTWSAKIFGKHESTITLFKKPIIFSVWVLTFFYIIENALHAFHYTDLDNFVIPLKTSLLIAAFGFGVQAYKSHFLKLYMKRNPLNQDANVINGIDKLLSIAIVIIASLLILDTLGFKSGPLLAFGGVGAAALGFAAKDVISNFFGGFMLVVSRPFNLGDLVLIPERKIEAHIIHVGWYMTTLRDKAKRFIYLPNSAFVNAYIINSSRRTHRKIEQNLMVVNSDKTTALRALNLIRQQLEMYPGIDLKLKPYACLESCDYDTFSIKISAYTEIKDEKEFFQFQEELILNLCETLKNAGLKFQTSQYVLTTDTN